MKAKVYSVLLICAMLLVFCVSCSENAPEESKTVSETGSVSSAESLPEEISAEESSEDEFYDGLPDVKFDRDFTILQRTEYKYEFAEDEQASEKVNTLIAERNRLVENRFGVRIKTIEQNGAWGVHEDFMNYVRNTVNGNTADYQLIAGYAAITPSLVYDGLFVNWHEVEHINLNKKWWSQDFISEMSINNNLYMITGDIAITMWEAMYCMFFNKDLAKANNLELYDMVRKGKWTFDAMHQIIKDTYIPVDDPESRVYGYCTAFTTQIDVYQDAFDIPVTEKDGNGRPYFTINQEKTQNALEMINSLVNGTDYSKFFAVGADECKVFFGQGKALFSPLPLGYGTDLQSYDVEYGILPMPKYNEEQDAYHSTCSDFYSVFAIPLTSADDTDFIGTITEALCVESSRSVIPEYYNLVLKTRNTSDDDSAEMIETVKDGLLCNFGYLYSCTLDWPAHQLNICVNNKAGSFSTNWQAKESMFNVNLEHELEAYFN